MIGEEASLMKWTSFFTIFNKTTKIYEERLIWNTLFHPFRRENI